jgi:hypothetical protein
MHFSEVDAAESVRSVVEVERTAIPKMLMMTALGTALALLIGLNWVRLPTACFQKSP